jgi:hypothetical protein
MRVAPWWIAGFALVVGVRAAEPALPAARADRSLTAAEFEKRWQIEQRAHELYPRRRDSPLRYQNITDGEVREIQRLAAASSFREVVNISAVVTGCACEEGADCTEQVYILGKYEERIVGMQLSRMKNRWSIGRVQRWWLDYAALQARQPQMERAAYEQARGRMLLEFPMCPAAVTVDASTASAATPGVKK